MGKAAGNKDIKQVRDFDVADVEDVLGRKFDYHPEGVSVILSTDTTDQLATSEPVNDFETLTIAIY